MANATQVHKINSAGAVVIPSRLRRQLGIDTGDRVSFSFTRGGLFMEPVTTKKISKADLREPPAWLKEARERFKNSPLGRMTEKEIGQLCEELAKEGAKKRMAKAGQRP